jgi:hypothetical protein
LAARIFRAAFLVCGFAFNPSEIIGKSLSFCRQEQPPFRHEIPAVSLARTSFLRILKKYGIIAAKRLLRYMSLWLSARAAAKEPTIIP